MPTLWTQRYAQRTERMHRSALDELLRPMEPSAVISFGWWPACHRHVAPDRGAGGLSACPCGIRGARPCMALRKAIDRCGR